MNPRSIRVFNIAIFDVIATIFGAYILHKFIPKYSFPVILIGLFLLGILTHRLLGIRTTIDKLLFA
jgi:hypothetical protein